MKLSTIIGLVWVFLVSIVIRGWLVSFHLSSVTFWVGVAYVIVKLLEELGIWRHTFVIRRDANHPVA